VDALPSFRLSLARIAVLVAAVALAVALAAVSVGARERTYGASARIAVDALYPLTRYELEGRAAAIESALRTDEVLAGVSSSTGVAAAEIRGGLRSEVTVGGSTITVSISSTSAELADEIVRNVATSALISRAARELDLAEAQVAAAETEQDAAEAERTALAAAFGDQHLANLAAALDGAILGIDAELARLTADDPLRGRLEQLRAERIESRIAVQAVLPAWTRADTTITDLDAIRRDADRTRTEAAARLSGAESGQAVSVESAALESRSQQYLRAGVASVVGAIAACLVAFSVLDRLATGRRQRARSVIRQVPDEDEPGLSVPA
jgi:hypothetical protein